MSINNKMNLPKPLVDWLSNDEYDHEEDTISTTTLLKSVRQFWLEQRHKDELEVDVSDLIASKFGTAIHNSFELAFDLKSEYTQEVRHYKEIANRKVSGKYDFILDDTIHDIKTTSVWTYMFDSNKDKYIQQMSIYRWLIGKDSLKDYGNIVYVFTDWSKSKSLQDRDYPAFRAIVKSYPLMSFEETEQFVLDKVERINSLKDVADSDLPYCTKDELWQDDDKFAVYKKASAKRATKVFNNLNEAQKFQRDQGCSHIEHRKGGVNACNYCKVTKFCNQYQMLEDQGLIK